MKIFRLLFLTVSVCLFSAGFLAGQTAAEAAAGLFVETDVAKAEVYLNGIFQGLTPLTIKPVETGVWQLTIKKNGYYQESYTIKIAEGEQKKISVGLTLITGTLIVENAPSNAEFDIDGKIYTSHSMKLAEGVHNVIIRAFGYTEKSSNVSIDRNKEKVIDGKLETAAFNVAGLRPLKSAFNPENPSNLGKTEITFTASAKGTGKILVLDASGETVAILTLPPFATWKQTFLWDGRDSRAYILPDGTYSIRLQAQEISAGNNEPKLMELASAVKIDRSIVYPLTESFMGLGSTGPVVSAFLMPANGALIQFDVLYLPGIFNPGLSAVIGFSDNIEGGFRVAMAVGEDSENSLDISAALKGGMKKGKLGGALSLRYGASSDKISANVPVIRKGLAFGPAVEYRMKHLAVGGNAELAYGNGEGLFTEAFLTGAAGLAIRFYSGVFSGAVWGYTEGPQLISFGISPSLIIPSTNLVLSAQTGYQAGARYTDTYFFRLGFGVLF